MLDSGVGEFRAADRAGPRRQRVPPVPPLDAPAVPDAPEPPDTPDVPPDASAPPDAPELPDTPDAPPDAAVPPSFPFAPPVPFWNPEPVGTTVLPHASAIRHPRNGAADVAASDRRGDRRSARVRWIHVIVRLASKGIVLRATFDGRAHQAHALLLRSAPANRTGKPACRHSCTPCNNPRGWYKRSRPPCSVPLPDNRWHKTSYQPGSRSG